MAKIVLDAGHGMKTPGKRCLKSIDPNETREWWLNQRIVVKVIDKLKAYNNVEIVRVDDPTGETDVALKTRTDIANRSKADLYCSFHHDAGADGGPAGGISVFTYDNREELVKLRDMIYESLRNHGGLGGRSDPKKRNNLHVLRETNMNAVLVEHGFMDSTTDTKVILTEEYAEKMAEGWVDFFVQYFNLTKKSSDESPTKPKNEEIKMEPDNKKETTNATSAFNAYTVKVTVSALNIRSEATIKSKINGCIRDKGVYTIVDEVKDPVSGNKFGKLKSGAGWIALQYTKRVKK